MPQKSDTATQILTVYLTKDTHTRPDALLKPGARCAAFDIAFSPGIAGRLYVQPGIPKPPKWATFFTKAIDTRQFGEVTSSAALLIVPVGGRLVAVTFGHGRYLLTPDCWEERFGLRVALNSIDENKVRSIDKHTFDAIARHSREQASREASARDFGIDVEQDLLRGVTGIPKNASLGKRMYGMDALSVAVPTTLANLPELLDRYIEKYHDTSYRKTFPFVDQIAEIGDRAIVERLDDELITKIKSDDHSGVWMAVPEILSWEKVGGFRFCLRSSCPEHYDLHLAAFLEDIGGPDEVSKAALVTKAVHCRDPDGGPFETWPVRRCLYAELDIDKDSYVLSGGKWYRVTRDFVKDVNDAYARIPSGRNRLPEYNDGSETAYNLRVATGDGRYALMDQKDVQYGGGHSSVEFCDLFTQERDIIHVKRYGSSAVLSHLFSQGLVSGELFQTDGEFRRQVNRKLPRTHRLADFVRRPRRGEFRVVFAVISDTDGDLTLPFFSRLNIKHAARRLEGYGYNVAKLKVPVAAGRRKLKKFR
jgi:uncharacterized protein (TIGR04141 family)